MSRYSYQWDWLSETWEVYRLNNINQLWSTGAKYREETDARRVTEFLNENASLEFGPECTCD
jgi:hypothetical protein